MFHFPGPFHWKIRTARQLEKMGLDESADAIWGITEKSTRERHEKEARKAQRRAGRKSPFGKLLNILGF